MATVMPTKQLVVDLGLNEPGHFGGIRRSASGSHWLGAEGSPQHGALAIVAQLVAGSTDNDPALNACEEFKQAFMSASEFSATGDNLETAFEAVNTAVHRRSQGRTHISCTAIAVQGEHWYLGHAGNNRAYSFRDSRLHQISDDHIEPRLNDAPKVVRALGIAAEIHNQTHSGTVSHGDILLILSQEIHDKLNGPAIVSVLMGGGSATAMANALVQKAGKVPGADDAAVAVIKISTSTNNGGTQAKKGAARPPVGQVPELDRLIDGFSIRRGMRRGRLSNYLYAVDTIGDLPLILKFPSPGATNRPELVEAYLRDEWLTHNTQSPFLPRPVPINPGRRHVLYSVFEAIEGENIAKRTKRKGVLPVKEVVYIAKHLMAFLQSIHDQHIIHRDIRPENLVIDRHTKRIMVLGFDSHRIQRILGLGQQAALQVLNPVFLAPEVWTTREADPRIDLYSAGVTLYYLLTHKLPYGRIASTDALFGAKYTPAHQYNREVPKALSKVLARACAAKPKDRYSEAQEFLAAFTAAAGK